MAAQRARVHYATGQDHRPTNPTRAFTTPLRKARPVTFLSTTSGIPLPTLPLEQGVELVVSKELLGRTHIGATATVLAHVRLRLPRAPSVRPLMVPSTMNRPTTTVTTRRSAEPPSTDLAADECRHCSQEARQAPPGGPPCSLLRIPLGLYGRPLRKDALKKCLEVIKCILRPPFKPRHFRHTFHLHHCTRITDFPMNSG